MIQFHVYPGGKKRVATFSYDDGHANDARLISMFNAHGVRGTFHLNGNNYIGIDEERAKKLRNIYEGHEVACHTLRHGWPARMPMQSVVAEVMEDRRILEGIFGYPIIGMSYPSGSFSDEAIMAMSACGIVYSRTALSTQNFCLPENFMQWHPSGHHRDGIALCEKFLASIDSEWTHPLLYIWGHAHEFRCEDDWTHMETVLGMISGNEKIWYATNMEIYNYMTAQKRLIISADERIFYNPSDISVWVERNKKEIIEIPSGKTIEI